MEVNSLESGLLLGCAEFSAISRGFFFNSEADLSLGWVGWRGEKRLKFSPDDAEGIVVFQELGDPVGHVHGDAAHGLAFGEDEVLFDEVIESREFFLLEVADGNDGVEVVEICAVILAVVGSCKEILYN